jgi:hypothetical protein
MNGKEYFVENHGYLFCIHDFGQSKFLSPTYSSGIIYGTRNVLVYDGKLFPIKFENATEIIWLDGRIGTNNKFTMNSISILDPDNLVDLTDMKKFPPMEFYTDIHRLLLRFNDLPKIRSIYTPGFLYDANSAMYLRADIMLDYLYEKPIGVTNADIVQTFYFH